MSTFFLAKKGEDKKSDNSEAKKKTSFYNFNSYLYYNLIK